MSTESRRAELERIARTVFSHCGEMTPAGFEKAFQYFSDDIFMDWPFGPPPRVTGKAACRTFLLANILADFTISMDNLFVDAERDTTIIMAHSEGKNPRTGKTYGNSYVLIFRYRNGLIKEWYEYLNPIEVMKMNAAATD